LIYAPKRLALSTTYDCRIKCAALDWNEKKDKNKHAQSYEFVTAEWQKEVLEIVFGKEILIKHGII